MNRCIFKRTYEFTESHPPRGQNRYSFKDKSFCVGGYLNLKEITFILKRPFDECIIGLCIHNIVIRTK